MAEVLAGDTVTFRLNGVRPPSLLRTAHGRLLYVVAVEEADPLGPPHKVLVLSERPPTEDADPPATPPADPTVLSVAVHETIKVGDGPT